MFYLYGVGADSFDMSMKLTDTEMEKINSNDPAKNNDPYMVHFVEIVASRPKLRKMEESIKQQLNLPTVSVLISHVAWAHGGIDTMVRHTNAGVSDLDRATIGLSRRTPALKTPYT